MKKVTIFTAANDRYFSLVEGLINSIHDCGIMDANDISLDYIVSIKLFDMGLKKYHIAELEDKCDIIDVKDFDLAKFYPLIDKTNLTSNQFAFLARPFLPEFENEADVIMWMDADSYVQNRKGIEYYIWSALKLNLPAFTPEINRLIYYNEAYIAETKASWDYHVYGKFFGPDVANRFKNKPIVNDGVFAIPAKHKLWSDWQNSARFALLKNKRHPDFGIDQISVNYALYQNQHTFSPLPYICNYGSVLAKPYLMNNKLVVPAVPFEEILIMHLFDQDKFRMLPIKRIDNNGVLISESSMFIDYANISSFGKGK